jgi:hypothetical protein
MGFRGHGAIFAPTGEASTGHRFVPGCEERPIVEKCGHPEIPPGENHEKTMKAKTKAVFYHAGCPVCVSAEQHVATALDPERYATEVVHLGRDKSRLAEAERAGVKSVPALVLEGQAFHINHGADLTALK